MRYAILFEQLPVESRYLRKHCPDLEWRASDYLLRSIDYTLRLLNWGFSKDAQKGRNKPQPIKTPGEIAAAEERKEHALANRSEIDAILGIGGDK